MAEGSPRPTDPSAPEEAQSVQVHRFAYAVLSLEDVPSQATGESRFFHRCRFPYYYKQKGRALERSIPKGPGRFGPAVRLRILAPLLLRVHRPVVADKPIDEVLQPLLNNLSYRS